MKFNILSPEEENVILDKNIEIPYTGKYEDFYRDGCYICKRCGAYLYNSKDKFDAHCGWPSFDDAVLGAIKTKLDPLDFRKEILCNRCGAHLGHVFDNENLTPKNTRHCVNSISMKFLPTEENTDKSGLAYFGGGCFWCLEAAYKMLKGVISVSSGYSGGRVMVGDKKPSYEEVSTGNTGYAEMVMIKFDKSIISFEALLEVFFVVHDPTTLNKQGNDIGKQYRSLILYQNDLQKELTETFIKQLEKEKVFTNMIVTEVKPLIIFYPAEDYHHDFYDRNPANTYCQSVVAPKLSKLRDHFKSYLKPQI